MATSQLEIRELSLTYEGHKILDDISLSFGRGSFNVIVGENGSGKTQLIKHFNGLIKAQQGDVLLNGVSIQKNIQKTRQQIALLFQNSDTQIVGQTLASDIAFGPENLKWRRKDIDMAVDKILIDMHLESLRDRLPYSLSGGEKKRLCLASLLVMQPHILVLDEPFVALDFAGVQDILKQIIRFHEQGNTVVLVTHDIEKVLRHADNLVILEKGRVAFEGHPALGLENLEQYKIRRPWGKNRSIETMTWLNE